MAPSRTVEVSDGEDGLAVWCYVCLVQFVFFSRSGYVFPRGVVVLSRLNFTSISGVRAWWTWRDLMSHGSTFYQAQVRCTYPFVPDRVAACPAFIAFDPYQAAYGLVLLYLHLHHDHAGNSFLTGVRAGLVRGVHEDDAAGRAVRDAERDLIGRSYAASSLVLRGFDWTGDAASVSSS